MRSPTTISRRSRALALFPAAFVVCLACTPQDDGVDVGETIEDAVESVEEALDKPETPLAAKAELDGGEESGVTGVVTFVETLGGILVNGELSGLQPGQHGFHIHEHGDCSGEGFESAGGHFNPGNTEHGGPLMPSHHAGDLGNLEADELGHASYSAEIGDIRLQQGPTSIVGKAVIVHEEADDLETQPTGGAGARIACGVIELTESAMEAAPEESRSGESPS